MLRIKIKYSTNYIGIFILLLYFCIIVGTLVISFVDLKLEL